MRQLLFSTVLLVLVLSACSGNKKVVTLSDYDHFEAAGFLSEQELVTLSQTPAGAMVPLVFNSVGALLTPQQFNALTNSQWSTLQIQYTDLSTFRIVMGQLVINGTQAASLLAAIQEQYAHVLPLGTTVNGETSVYAFDPYETLHLTESQIAAIFSNETATTKTTSGALSTQDFSGAPPVWVADIVVRSPNFPTIGNTGHAGVVTQNNCGSLRCSGNPNNDNTLSMEANKLEATTADDLQEFKLKLHFDPAKESAPIYLDYVPGLTDTQITNIRNFARRQNPGSYYIGASKALDCDGLSTCKWYCSLLVWEAYMKYTGKNLDPGGGFWVWPYDLINSSHTRTYAKQ